jgi:hypothetical protein
MTINPLRIKGNFLISNYRVRNNFTSLCILNTSVELPDYWLNINPLDCTNNCQFIFSIFDKNVWLAFATLYPRSGSMFMIQKGEVSSSVSSTVETFFLHDASARCATFPKYLREVTDDWEFGNF